MRLHEHPDAVIGDDYVATTTVTMDDEKVSDIRGFAMDHAGLDAWSAMRAGLRTIGATAAIWTRKRHGVSHVVRVRVRAR
jgi:hypothetical protein